MKTATLLLIILSAVLAQILAFFLVILINRSRARKNDAEKEDE